MDTGSATDTQLIPLVAFGGWNDLRAGSGPLVACLGRMIPPGKSREFLHKRANLRMADRLTSLDRRDHRRYHERVTPPHGGRGKEARWTRKTRSAD